MKCDHEYTLNVTCGNILQHVASLDTYGYTQAHGYHLCRRAVKIRDNTLISHKPCKVGKYWLPVSTCYVQIKDIGPTSGRWIWKHILIQKTRNQQQIWGQKREKRAELGSQLKLFRWRRKVLSRLFHRNGSHPSQNWVPAKYKSEDDKSKTLPSDTATGRHTPLLGTLILSIA